MLIFSRKKVLVKPDEPLGADAGGVACGMALCLTSELGNKEYKFKFCLSDTWVLYEWWSVGWHEIRWQLKSCSSACHKNQLPQAPQSCLFPLGCSEWLLGRRKSHENRHIVSAFLFYLAAAAKSLQSCPTLCDPIDRSPPGSAIPGILQARTLEWVAISFSNAQKWKVKGKSLSRVWLFATPWTAAYQAPPSMGFSRQEYWSGLPLPSPSSILVPQIFAGSEFMPVGSTQLTHFTKPQANFAKCLNVSLVQQTSKILPVKRKWII